MDNDSIVFYAWYKRAIDRLKDPDKQLSAYQMIFNYAFKGIVPDKTTSCDEVLLLFESVKDSIDESKSGRNSQGYKCFRKRVLERDGYTCRHCGSTKDLHVHHILPYAYYPEERINIDNGITLCKTCHYKEHRK